MDARQWMSLIGWILIVLGCYVIGFKLILELVALWQAKGVADVAQANAIKTGIRSKMWPKYQSLASGRGWALGSVFVAVGVAVIAVLFFLPATSARVVPEPAPASGRSLPLESPIVVPILPTMSATIEAAEKWVGTAREYLTMGLEHLISCQDKMRTASKNKDQSAAFGAVKDATEAIEFFERCGGAVSRAIKHADRFIEEADQVFGQRAMEARKSARELDGQLPVAEARASRLKSEAEKVFAKLTGRPVAGSDPSKGPDSATGSDSGTTSSGRDRFWEWANRRAKELEEEDSKPPAPGPDVGRRSSSGDVIIVRVWLKKSGRLPVGSTIQLNLMSNSRGGESWLTDFPLTEGYPRRRAGVKTEHGRRIDVQNFEVLVTSEVLRGKWCAVQESDEYVTLYVPADHVVPYLGDDVIWAWHDGLGNDNYVQASRGSYPSL